MPLNLNVAFGLARIQEEYIFSTKRTSRLIGEKGSLSTASDSWGRVIASPKNLIDKTKDFYSHNG